MNGMYSVEDYTNGQVLLLDKPLEWTSFQVVNKLRWHIKKKFGLKKIKVGHAGTLDPLASGLLIICTGRKTKEIEKLQGQEKEYIGSFVLGATTPSFDLETEVDQIYPIDHITQEQIFNSAKSLTGTIEQIPPVFSALKKEGKRLYEYARRGEHVELPSRSVHISEFEITDIQDSVVHFRVVCSKGTYIRSLAYDFGRQLKSGAYLGSLRRTRIGNYRVESALDVNSFVIDYLSERH